jgi:hypothetical protein
MVALSIEILAEPAKGGPIIGAPPLLDKIQRTYFVTGPSGSTVLPNNSLSTCASPA